MMKTDKKKEIHELVQAHYNKAAKQKMKNNDQCCSCNVEIGGEKVRTGSTKVFEKYNYSVEDIINFFGEEIEGLCCGNPTEIAEIKEGETVLDLGSGGGLDCYIAAKRVGPRGKVIGIDFSEDMVEYAKNNIKRAGLTNAEIKLGKIEEIP